VAAVVVSPNIEQVKRMQPLCVKKASTNAMCTANVKKASKAPAYLKKASKAWRSFLAPK
jgi:hypothetical protein